MKTRFLVLFLALALLPSAFAQKAGQTVYSFKRFTAQTVTGYTTAFQFASGHLPAAISDEYAVSGDYAFLPTMYTITVTPTGAPATCTYQVYGTLKLTIDTPVTADFSGGEMHPVIDCTVKTTIVVSSKALPTVIGRLVTLTGGTAPTVQLEIMAK